MKVNLIQSKNGVLANVGVSVKSYIIEALVRMSICGILARVIVSKINHVKLTDDQILKKVCGRLLFVKLVLACEDDISNITAASFDDNKVTCQKCNYLIHTISLVIICLLLLVVISISSNYYYILVIISCHFYLFQLLLQKKLTKQKHLLPYNDTNIKLKGIDINNVI